MLIKSECQPLDKTRHKLAWNLFEQCELCKMAREICSAAWPLNSTHNPVIITSHNMSRETDRRPERESDTVDSTEAHLFCSLSGDISPPTLWIYTKVWWHDHVPLHSHVLDAFIKSPWQSQSWRQDIRTCWNHSPCNYRGTKPLWADLPYEIPSIENQRKECWGLVCM